MGLRWTVVLVAATACYRPALDENCRLSCSGPESCPTGLACGTSGFCSANNTCPGDTPNPDGGVDGMIDGATVACYGGGLLEVCIQDTDEDVVDLVAPIDTDRPGSCSAIRAQSGGPELCIIRARSVLTVNSIRVSGARPLVLAAAQIVVGGTLDVSSGGAGKEIAADASQHGIKILDGGLRCGSGGAGGSFAGRGGDGGGASGGTLSVNGGSALAALPSFPSIVIGGGPGGDGASGNAGVGTGGAGGGAVYLASAAININGVIDAGGGGGIGATASAGGGGGGAGGMIVLDAPMILVTSTGKLIAAGGGGASGSSQMAVGQNGEDPDITATTTTGVTASGGVSAGTGGDGGDGSSFSNSAGAMGNPGGVDDVGGGGGGGGSGFIRFFSSDSMTLSGAVLVPSASVLP